MKVLPVIHSQSRERDMDQAALALSLGADGVFFINHHGDDTLTIQLTQDTAKAHPDKIIGANFLSLDPIRAAEAAAQYGITHLWLDNAGIHSETPDIVMQERLVNIAQANHITIYAGVAFKYQRHEPNPEAAAIQALLRNFIPVTSGAGTGVAADLNKIRTLSPICVGKLGVASGLTPDNISDYAPLLGYGLVSTGICDAQENIIPEALSRFIERARANAL